MQPTRSLTRNEFFEAAIERPGTTAELVAIPACHGAFSLRLTTPSTRHPTPQLQKLQQRRDVYLIMRERRLPVPAQDVFAYPGGHFSHLLG